MILLLSLNILRTGKITMPNEKNQRSQIEFHRIRCTNSFPQLTIDVLPKVSFIVDFLTHWRVYLML